jgi:NADPH oxidase
MPSYPSAKEPSPDAIANFLRISIYLTQKMDQDTVQNIAINDIGQEFEYVESEQSYTALFVYADIQSFDPPSV